MKNQCLRWIALIVTAVILFSITGFAENLTMEEADIGTVEVIPNEVGELILLDEAPYEEEAQAEAAVPDNSVIVMGVKETYAINTKELGKKLTFKSSRSKIASVSKKGVITAKKQGEATISCYSNKTFVTSYDVKVIAAPKSVSLGVKSITIGLKEAVTLSPSIPSDSHATYKWSTKSKKIATVSNNGLITGKKVGKTTVTVKTQNGKKATVTVNVAKAPAQVSLDKSSVTLKAGGTVQLTATLPSKTASYQLTWTSGNDKVAKVSSKGEITAIAAGQTVITVATFNGQKATCTVTVPESTPTITPTPTPTDNRVVLSFYKDGTFDGWPGDEDNAKVIQAFKKQVEALSGGTMGVNIIIKRPDSFGSIIDDYLGNCDLGLIYVGELERSYGCSMSKIFDVPYLFANPDHFYKFADSDLSQKLLNETYDKGLGVHGVCYWLGDIRGFAFRDRIVDVEGFKGRVIRANTDSYSKLVSALGGSPMWLMLPETGPALAYEILDGAILSIDSYVDDVYYKVAPYLLMDGCYSDAYEIIISDAAWKKLNKEQQGIVMKAGRIASREIKKKWDALYDKNSLKKKGITVIESIDRATLMAACKDVIDEYVGSNIDIYQQIQKMQ